MRKLMTMACAMIMAAAANATEVNTVAFNEARVNLPARVRFVKGENYGFSVAAKDSVLAKAIRCTVKDGVLRVGYGNAIQPGTSKFDEKKATYYYGVNAPSMTLPEESTDALVITVMAPEMPTFRTSSDYVSVTVKEVKEFKNSRVELTMNE